MPATIERTCVSCRRGIDVAARICPFCGADPETGARMDIKPLMETHFPPPPEISPLEKTANFFRTRQTLSIAILILVGAGLLAAAHQWIQRRNRMAVAPTPGVTLTELADLARQYEERAPLPLPELEFGWEGEAKRMQTFVLEPGAIAPPVEPQPAEGQPPAAVTPQQPPTTGPQTAPPPAPQQVTPSTQPAKAPPARPEPN